MTQTAVHRKVNFSAGPAVLPVEVLEEAKENILSLGDTGVGIMEHSHRGKPFVAVLEQAMADLRQILGAGDDFDIMFLTGGATTQFFMVPMNFLAGGKKANYHDTGSWSAKAIKEAKLFGDINVSCSSKDDNYTHIPKNPNDQDDAVYTHFTSNNTIFGTQYRVEPATATPLVCDASSDILSRPIDLKKYGVLYGGAQKNIGPAGVTVVVMRKDFTEKTNAELPSMLQYKKHVDADSCLNTAPTFPIFVAGLVFKWILKQGGLEAVQKVNESKAKVLYDCLDGSDFWTTPVAKEDRSLMNVVFRLPNEDLEKKLIADASAAGFDGLKGHRSVGGLRASIYNAMPEQSIKEFVDYLKEWERTNG